MHSSNHASAVEWVCLCWLGTIVAVFGCDSGPPRFEVSGIVTYNGDAIPKGRLVFTPDRAKGNKGPQGVAIIEQGEIISNTDRKVIGGPHWLQIIAFDGVPVEDGEGIVAYGRPLFPMQMAPVNLPRRDVEISVHVAEADGQFTTSVNGGLD